MNQQQEITREEVLKMLEQIGDQEKHFNNIETQYRLLASTWLLASLGAIGYLIKSETDMSINLNLLIGLIGNAAGLGILLIWILDMKVYHKLLQSFYLQGILLEIKHPWLPKTRTDMLMAQEGDVTRNTNAYYALSAGFLFVIGMYGLANLAPLLYQNIVLFLGGILAIIAVIYKIWHSGKSYRTKAMVQLLSKTYKDEITTMKEATNS